LTIVSKSSISAFNSFNLLIVSSAVRIYFCMLLAASSVDSFALYIPSVIAFPSFSPISAPASA